MKVPPHQALAALCKPDQWVGALLYGEDWGVVQERAKVATEAVIGAPTHPFRLTVLTREEHSRLAGELRERALGGGRRVLRVSEATDGLTETLKRAADHREDVFVIAEAGALTPRSKLRSFAERQGDWAAIACYPERTAGVTAEIQRYFQQVGVKATLDAVRYLTEELEGDSMRRRAELEKVALYAAGSPILNADMARAACSSQLETTIVEAISSAMLGQVAQCDEQVDVLRREGATGPGLLAVLSSQVHRLLRVRAVMDAGFAAEDAVGKLVPPVFPSQAGGMVRQAERWPPEALEALGRAIRDADLACKRAGSADFAIAARLLGTVAAWTPAGAMRVRAGR